MPLNWNDETIPSEADKTTDILGFKEIGGIGQDRKSTRLNSSHNRESRMPSSA